MSDYCNCILGQLEGTYTEALRKWDMTGGESAEIGLEIYSQDYSYSELTAEWISYIEEGR